MAFGIRIGSEFLHVSPDATLQLEINHDIWAPADPVDIIGTFTIPITVSLDPHNNRLLKYPSRLDSGYTLLADEEVWLYIGEGAGAGLPYRRGELYVRGAGRDSAKIMLTIGTSLNLKSTKFTDLDLPVIDTGFLGKSIQAHAKDTAVSPAQWNHIFFPVLNRSFIGQKNVSAIESMQNYYKDGAFGEDDYDLNLIVTPFLKVQYLLQVIADHLGVSLNDQLIAGTDLENLCVYNNYNAYEVIEPETDGVAPVIGWPDEIAYSNHVPSGTLSDFLKIIAKQFFCSVTITNDELIIRPLIDSVVLPPSADWTTKSSHSYNKSQLESVPKYYYYLTDFTEETIPVNAIYDPAVGLYYSEITRQRPSGPNSTVTITIRNYHRNYEHLVADGISDAAPMAARPINMLPMFVDGRQPTPEISIGGTGTFVYQDALGDLTYTTAENQINDVILMIYRGIYTIDGFSYPFASNNAWDPTTDSINSAWHSLLIDGDEGIGSRFGAPVVDMLKDQMQVERDVKLSITDILNIKPTDKVRIENLHYFVSRIRLQITLSDISVATCTLLRVNV